MEGEFLWPFICCTAKDSEPSCRLLRVCDSPFLPCLFKVEKALIQLTMMSVNAVLPEGRLCM